MKTIFQFLKYGGITVLLAACAVTSTPAEPATGAIWDFFSRHP